MAIKAIDLFSGCGGVSCGLTRAGFKVKAAVEIDPEAARTYSAYPPLANVNVLIDDICKLSGKKILQTAGIKTTDLYLLAGCPPCQNFSMQNPKNKLKPESERKRLLFEFLRIIKEAYPPFVLMENVPGLASAFNINILTEFLSSLRNESGIDAEKYYVTYDILNAADFGVPQLRKRFVLHAVRKDIYDELLNCGVQFALPLTTHDKNGENGLQPWVTVRDAIGDLPAIKAGECYNDPAGIINNHKCADLSEKNIAKMRFIRAHGCSRTCLPDDMVLECHKKKDNLGNVFSGHRDVYGIMKGDKPAPTMTGGCLFYSKGRYGHYEQDRAISIREAARIQTFPDDFEFQNNLAKAALQIGNAVPIKLVEASGKVFLGTINQLKKFRRKMFLDKGGE